MPTPCYLNADFHGTPRQQRRAKALCTECPVKDICLELGIGEEDGVYGGTDPQDLVRVAFRQSVDRNETCPNGHSKELYGHEMEGPGHRFLESCTRCAGLQLQLAGRAS